MAPVSVSLVEFLKTGRLGPLSTGLSQAEVRILLGPPDDWDDRHDGQHDGGESSYWMYGENLEISFRREPPFLISWFQLDHLQFKAAHAADTGGRFSFEMDKLTWTSPPSAFIQAAGLEEVEVQVDLLSGHLEFRLFFGDAVEMFFVLADPTLSTAEIRSMQNLTMTLRDLERHSLVESIYAFPQTHGRDERMRMRAVHGSSTTWMTGRAYLALVATEGA